MLRFLLNGLWFVLGGFLMGVGWCRANGCGGRSEEKEARALQEPRCRYICS